MIRRVFWFSVGAGAGVFVLVKTRQYLIRATPRALAGRVSGSAADLTEAVRDFVDQVRAAMAEREAELRDALGLDDAAR